MKFIDKEDLKIVLSITKNHQDYFTFDEEEWFSNEKNFCLKSGRNLSFAEWKSPGVYWVHFCFDTARGRKAIILVGRMLKKFYSEKDPKTCIGLVHVDNRKARWLLRQTKFKSSGTIETRNGLCEMFYYSKDEK